MCNTFLLGCQKLKVTPLSSTPKSRRTQWLAILHGMGTYRWWPDFAQSIFFSYRSDFIDIFQWFFELFFGWFKDGSFWWRCKFELFHFIRTEFGFTMWLFQHNDNLIFTIMARKCKKHTIFLLFKLIYNFISFTLLATLPIRFQCCEHDSD